MSVGGTENAVDTAVCTRYLPGERLSIEAGKWLLNSSKATSKEVSDDLGISETTTFIIIPIRGYYGRAQPDIWEWLASKATAHA